MAEAEAGVLSPAARRKLWLGVLPAMLLPMLGAVLYYRVLNGQPSAPYVYGGIKVFTLLWPLVALLLIARERLWQPGGPGFKAYLQAVPLGLLIGVGLAFLILGLYVWSPLGPAVQVHGTAVKERVAGLGVLPYFVPFACFLSLAHSLLEEYYWRWYVGGQLARLLPLRLAVPLGGVAFALHHLVVLNGYFGWGLTLLCGCAVAVGGMLWSWQLRYQRGSLLGVWAAHALADAAIMIIGYQLVSP